MKTLSLNTEYIKKYMKNNNIKSYSQLAKNIGISESTLNRLLHNKRNPGQKVISLMLSYFQEEFDQLFILKETKDMEEDLE